GFFALVNLGQFLIGENGVLDPFVGFGRSFGFVFGGFAFGFGRSCLRFWQRGGRNEQRTRSGGSRCGGGHGLGGGGTAARHNPVNDPRRNHGQSRDDAFLLLSNPN